MADTGIFHISSYIPESSIDNFALAQSFGENETFVINRIGAHTLPIKDAHQETSDMAVEALNNLILETNLPKENIDCLIVCTQNPDGHGLPHTSAIVQNKADLPTDTAAFDISLGCSGFVYGLKILKGFMDETSAENGVLITADPYSKVIDPLDRNTKMLFGDAATATLLTSKSAKYLIGRSSLCTDGQGSQHLTNIDGTLHMNGRQVFNFAATQVPRQISKILQAEGMDKNDVDLFILHQGSKYIIETIRTRMGIPEEKLQCRIKHTGNTISSSIPLLLKKHIVDNTLQTILLSGFGVGFSWGSVFLHHNR